MSDNWPPGCLVRHALQPGDIGYVTYLHGILYAQEQGWDYTFEAYVAGPLSEFARSQTDRERIWIVEKDGQVAGSMAIVAATHDEAQLRWFLLHPCLRGRGIGRTLIEEGLAFSRDKGYARLFLWTVSQLTVAGRLYRRAGFQRTEEQPRNLWGATVTEQRYELRLK